MIFISINYSIATITFLNCALYGWTNHLSLLVHTSIKPEMTVKILVMMMVMEKILVETKPFRLKIPLNLSFAESPSQSILNVSRIFLDLTAAPLQLLFAF